MKKLILILCLLPIFATAQQISELSKGLIFHAPLNEWNPARDLVSGTLGTATDTYNIADRQGSGSNRYYIYNGTSDYTSLPTSIPALSTADFSIIAKIKTGALGAIRTIIGGASNSFELYISATGYLTAVKYGGTALTASTNQLAANTEYKIAYLRSGTTGTYYVNGVSAGTTTDSNDYSVKCSLLGNGTGFFNGSFFVTRLFNYALTPTQIANYSKPEYPIEWVDRGAGVNDLPSTEFYNIATTTFTTTGGVVAETASFAQGRFGISAINCPITVGRNYKLSFDASNTSGDYYIRDISAYDYYVNRFTPSNIHYDLLFTAPVGTTGGLYIQSPSSSSSITLANIYLTQLGCVLDLNAEGISRNHHGVLASSTWGDCTNGTDATVSGVTAVIPSGSCLGGTYYNATTSLTQWTGMQALTGNITLFGKIFVNSFGEGNAGRIFDNSKCILYTNSTGYLTFSRDGSTAVNSAAASQVINTSYNFAVTSTSAGVTNFYINGILSGTANQSAGTPASGTTWNIGNNAAGSATFGGNIYKVGIIERVLDADAIKLLNDTY